MKGLLTLAVAGVNFGGMALGFALSLLMGEDAAAVCFVVCSFISAIFAAMIVSTIFNERESTHGRR